MQRRLSSPPSVLTVFVAAVADRGHQIARLHQHFLELRVIGGVQGKPEDSLVIGSMLGQAEAGADYYASNRRAVEYITDADVRDTNLMPIGDSFELCE